MSGSGGGATVAATTSTKVASTTTSTSITSGWKSRRKHDNYQELDVTEYAHTLQNKGGKLVVNASLLPGAATPDGRGRIIIGGSETATVMAENNCNTYIHTCT